LIDNELDDIIGSKDDRVNEYITSHPKGFNTNQELRNNVHVSSDGSDLLNLVSEP
jgi:hypothetical protein